MPTLPTMKKSCPKSGNNKLIVSSLQMTFPREKGCVTEIFKPPARFSVHLECDPAFECALFTLCIYPLKNPIVFLAKHPSPTGIMFNFIPFVLNPALFYNNPLPYPLVDPYQNSSQKAATTSTETTYQCSLQSHFSFFTQKKIYNGV